MGEGLFEGLGVAIDELAQREMILLYEFVYSVYRGHLGMTSIE